MSDRARPGPRFTTTWPANGRCLLILAVDGVCLQHRAPAEEMTDPQKLGGRVERMSAQLLRALAKDAPKGGRQ